MLGIDQKKSSEKGEIHEIRQSFPKNNAFMVSTPPKLPKTPNLMKYLDDFGFVLGGSS